MQLPARILLPLLLLFTVHFSRAQGITLSVENQALEKVMGSIEQQSGHRFVYSAEMMALSKPVTVNFRNETLNRALEIVFRDQPLTYTFNEKHIVLQVKKSKAAEDRRVFTGQVVDEKGEGLPGISVLIKGTRQGTMTDPLGQFRLEDVPASFRLLVSGVSIESREIAVSNTDFLKIETTPKLGELDQTVVIAYGTAKKRYLVESVSKVKGEDLSKQSVSNPILALGGRVAGLQIVQNSGVPGTSVTVRLRGRNSIANGLDPLIIVDGTPFPTGTVNPSIPFAGATSSVLDNLNPSNIESVEVLKDASATAIYGSRGANGVILITTKKGYGSRFSFNLIASTGFGKAPLNLRMLSTEQYLAMRKEAFLNDNSTPTNSNAPDLRIWDSTKYTNWQKALIGKTMLVSDAQVSVSLGSERTHILIGSGYRKESTVFEGDFYSDKISVSTNINHRSIDKRLDLSVSTNFLQNKNLLPREDLTTFIRTAPNAPDPFTSEGKLNWANSTWINPWTSILQYTLGNTQTWQSSLNIGYKLSRCIDLRLTGGFTSIFNNDSYRAPVKAFNPASNPVAKAGWNKREIRIRILEPQINYQKNINGKHQIGLLLGGSVQSSETEGYFIQGTGYASDELLGSITSANSITVTNESSVTYKYAALFSRFNYTLNDKYVFTGSVRRDASSRYGPSERASNFWAGGFAWIINKEKWLSGIKNLDILKLRGTYGITGNDQIGEYKYLDLYGPYSFSYMGVTTYSPTQLFSSSYSWEKVRKLEFGIDVNAFKSRIDGSIIFYNNSTSNQLVSYSLPYTTGFTGVLKNIPAVIRNYGWEFEFSAKALERKKLKWTVSANLTIPRNKLVSFKDFESSTYASTFAIGYPLNIVKVLNFEKVNSSSGLYQFTDYNNDGKISVPVDQQKIVSTAIMYFGGLENEVDIGRVAISCHLFFSKQPHLRNYYSFYRKPGIFENQSVEVLDRWVKSGDEKPVQRYSATASAPSTSYSNLVQSNAGYSDASFIRLRNAQISYSWKYYRLFVSGQNLITWTKFKGMDPETGSLLPPIRIVSGGFSIKL